MLIGQEGFLVLDLDWWFISPRPDVFGTRIRKALFGRVLRLAPGGDGGLAEVRALDIALDLAKQLEPDGVQLDAATIACSPSGPLHEQVIALSQLEHLDHVQGIAWQVLHIRVEAAIAARA